MEIFAREMGNFIRCCASHRDLFLHGYNTGREKQWTLLTCVSLGKQILSPGPLLSPPVCVFFWNFLIFENEREPR
jgi:hypothetical protein